MTLKTRLALRSLFAGGSITGLAYEDAQCTQPITNCEDPQGECVVTWSHIFDMSSHTAVLPDIVDIESCGALSGSWAEWGSGGSGPADCSDPTGQGYVAALEPDYCRMVDEILGPTCNTDHDSTDDMDVTYGQVCPCTCGLSPDTAVRWSTDHSGSCGSAPYVCLAPLSFGHAPGSQCGTDDDGTDIWAGDDGQCCSGSDWGDDPNWTCPTQPTCAIVQESGSGEVSLGCSNDMEGFPIADAFVSTARSHEVTCGDDDKLIYKEYLMDDCAGDAVTPEYSGSWNKPQAGYEQLYNGVAGGECLAIEGDDFFVKVESIVGVCSDPETPETACATLATRPRASLPPPACPRGTPAAPCPPETNRAGWCPRQLASFQIAFAGPGRSPLQMACLCW